MRKLKLQVQITIDGFVAGHNHEMNWMQLPWTEDLIVYVREFTAPIDTILLGRNLAEGFIPYWQQVLENPDSPDYEGAVKFTTTPKIVFSRTLQSSKWDNTIVMNGDFVEQISTLKQQQGGDIVAYGGAQFVSSLIKNNLIDEYCLHVNPTAIGKGLPIFNEISQHLQLELKECRKFDCGIALLKFVKK